MNRRVVLFLLWALSLLLSSCATFLGPHDVEIPLAKLQQSIDEKFPFKNRYLELLDVRVTNPQVTLLPETNRIMTSMDASIAPLFLNRTLNGNMAVSGQLRVDPSRNALVLSDPRIETFNVSGLNVLHVNRIMRIGGLLVEELLRDMPIYTFRPEDLRYAGSNLYPTKITTRANSLVVTFEAAK